MIGKIEIKKSKRYEFIFGNEGKGFIKEFLTETGKEFLPEWKRQSRTSRNWRLGRHKPNSPRAIPTKITVRSSRLIQQLYGNGLYSSGEGYTDIKINGTNFVYILGFKVPYSRRIFTKYQLFKKSVEPAAKKLQSIGNKVMKRLLK